MADGNQQLVIDLEARLTKFEKAFKKASGIANDNWKSVENRGRVAAERLDGSFARLARPHSVKIHVEESGLKSVQQALNNLRMPHDALNFEHLKGGLGGIAAGLGLEEVKKLSDLWTQAGNRIAAADVEARKVPIVLNEVAEIALRSRTSLEQVAQVFAGLNRAGQTFGASQAQALVATEAVTKAMTLSGSTTQEIQGALSDLTQGLQAGVLQGQELKALLREVPDFATALAKELHVGVGELKEMGSQGEITSEKVFRALLHASGSIDTKFAKTAATIEQAFGNLETAAARFVGTNSTLQGATFATTAALQGLANHFGIIGTGAAAVGLIVATRFISGALTPLTVSLAANARQALVTGAAHVEFANIVGTSVIRLGAATLATRAFSAALALVGGPVGAVLLGVTAAATWYAAEAQRAEVASRKYADAYDKLKASAMGAAGGIKQAGDAVAETAARMNAVELNNLGKELKQTEADAKSAVSGVSAALVEYQLQASSAGEASAVIFDRVPAGAEEANRALKNVEAALHGDAKAALTAQNEVNALANAHPDLQPLADRFNPLLAKLAGIRATLAALKSEIAGMNAPAAKPADTHWTGKLDVTKERDQFAGQILKDRIDDANKDDAYRARKKMADILKNDPGIVSPGDAYKNALKEIAIEDEPSGGKGHKAHKPNPFNS